MKKWREQVILYGQNLKIQTTIVRLIQVHANNIVSTLAVTISLYKVTCYLHCYNCYCYQCHFFIFIRSFFL